MEAGKSYLIGNLTGSKELLNIRGSLGDEKEVKMVLNARVQMDPGKLESIVLEEISKACEGKINTEVIAMKCLSPGRPNPTHRYNHIVK